jgi:hypothetical protein
MAVRLRPIVRGVAGVTTLCALAIGRTAVSAQDPRESRATLDRVSRYVEQYYGRAQTLMAEETVTLLHLQPDLSPDGRMRRLVYDLRVEWTPASDTGDAHATVVRQLLRIGGRRAKPDEKPECLDPRTISPEPLAFLLPERREKFRFNVNGRARLGRRDAVMLEYLPAASDPPVVTGDKTCISMDVPSRSRGRLWIDPATDAILRMDEFLVGPTDVRVPRELQSIGGAIVITIDRSDTSTQYEPVRFEDPSETLMLPSRIDSVSVIRATGVQRLRVTQEFKNYRRFLTASRIVSAP